MQNEKPGGPDDPPGKPFMAALHLRRYGQEIISGPLRRYGQEIISGPLLVRHPAIEMMGF